MFHIVLYEPEIPPNTGNIIRLCSNVGAHLHLIKPLGFELNDKRMRRAGLDYFTALTIYDNYTQFLQQQNPDRLFACSTKGKQVYSEATFQDNDYFTFGPETRGLPDTMLNELTKEMILHIPMQPENRSLNLANACSIIIYEAWRQLDFQ